jgi:hypothetical protein
LSKISNATCWALICKLFGNDSPTRESTLSVVEYDALAVLDDLRAVKPQKVDLRYVLCPYCQLHRGQVVRVDDTLVCQCPDCGAIPVETVDRQAWTFEADWLIRKLRGALNIPSQQAVVEITSSMWRIGMYQRQPVVLARSLDLVLQKPALLGRTRTTSLPWLITPKPLREIEHDPLAGMASWLPLEERFSLYGGNLGFMEPGGVIDDLAQDVTARVNGPFSADFHWVHLEGEDSPINLSPKQAAVFRSLWNFGGQSREAHAVMSRAGSSSDKPIDVFKVKSENKGKPEYEGPLRAFKALVIVTRNPGTYAMPCARQKRS